MALSSFSSQQGAASQPPSGESVLAQRLALLARLDPRVLRKLLKNTDPDLVLQLTRQPELIERLVQQPQSLDEVVGELSRLKPGLGPSLRGIRRFQLGGALRVGV